MSTGCDVTGSAPAVAPAVATIGVVGARGKTGHAVASALQDRDVLVRPVGRKELTDPGLAFSGCDAIYLIAPNMHPDEAGFVNSIVKAAAVAGVPRLVYHSVATPYAPQMPHHMGKLAAEDVIRHGPLAWTIIQPSPYLQNFWPALMSPQPELRVPYDVAKPFNFVDLGEVGEAAATVLLDAGHTGATYELGGVERVGVRDIAALAADVLGRRIPASRIEPAEWAASEGRTLDARQRRWLLAMFSYYDRFGLPAGSVTMRALLGREPTDIATALARLPIR